jgi:hypothetical protein
MAAHTVTVCSKLPFDLVAEVKGKSFTIKGAKGADPVTGEAILLPGYGLTLGVGKDTYDAWVADAKDFAPLANGAIFAETADKAAAAAEEMAAEVKTGLEQKSSDELGVEVSVEDKPKGK